MLNEQYEWFDVQYPINHVVSPLMGRDVSLSFVGTPAKKELLPGTVLYRLDIPVVLGIFMRVWWMKEPVFYRLFARAGSSSSALRREWQNRLAMSEPSAGEPGKLGGWTGETATRTQVLVIKTMQPVFAWVGIASALHQKEGGEEQVYLPNLAHGAGPNRSDYACLFRTYTLPAD